MAQRTNALNPNAQKQRISSAILIPIAIVIREVSRRFRRNFLFDFANKTSKQFVLPYPTPASIRDPTGGHDLSLPNIVSE